MQISHKYYTFISPLFSISFILALDSCMAHQASIKLIENKGEINV